MTVRRLGFVLINLSAAWLCCVSAGGAYCAKTARARAAALGLRLPGVRRGADLSRLPLYSLHPRASPQHHRLFQNNPQPPATGYNMLYNPSKDFPRFRPAGYGAAVVRANPLSGLSGGDPSNDRQSNFAQVKRVVGPLSQTQPPGRANFVDGASESHRSGLQFAFNGRYAGVVDPNRHSASGLAGQSRPHSSGNGLFYMPSPIGAGSKPGAVYPMGERGSQLPGGHSAWPVYARANNKPRYPFYKLGRS